MGQIIEGKGLEIREDHYHQHQSRQRQIIYYMLKGLGHKIVIRFKWYGLIGLGLEKVRQIFIIFLTVPLILN